MDIQAPCLRSRGGIDMSELSPAEIQGVEAVMDRQLAEENRPSIRRRLRDLAAGEGHILVVADLACVRATHPVKGCPLV